MRHAAAIRRSPRAVAALVIAAAAAVLLGGCVQIKAVTVNQPGKIGPVKVEHTVCLIFSTSSSSCPTSPTSGIVAGGVQMLAAYRVPSWAPAPTAPDFSPGGAHLAFTRFTSYEAQLQSLYPLAGTRWYGFVSAVNPALAAGATVQGPLTTSFDLDDTQTASFSHFAVVGFRLVGDSYGTASRPVTCGLKLTSGGITGDASAAACDASWWPNGGSGDTSPAGNEQEIALRNRLILTPPAGVTEITQGTSADVRFTATGTIAFLAVTVPVAATTTVPAGSASLPAPTLSINGTHELPATVSVPATTPPGDYVVHLTAGSALGSRSIDAPVRVVAPAPPTAPGGGTPTADGGGSTPGGGSTSASGNPTPVGTAPLAGTGSVPATTPTLIPDLTTFDSSVASAATTFAAASARADLRAGKLRIQVRAPRRGVVDAALKRGGKLLAKGQATAKKKGLVTVKLKLRPAGNDALEGSSAVSGTLTVRFKPRGKPANKTSVVVTIPAS